MLRQRTPPGSLRTSSSLVWRTPHLRSMAALAFISAAVTTIAALQFKAIASQSTNGVDHLATLFGSFNLYAGLVALATQLVVTPRVIDRFGLGPALAIAPAALAAGSGGVLWSGTLAAAMFMKGSDQVLRYSVDRAALELLYRPLPERELFEGKTFIDAIVSRFGDAAGAMLALFAVVVLQISFPSLGALTIPLILAWMLLARIAQRTYGTRLLDDLRRESASSQRVLPVFAHSSPAGARAAAATRRVLTRTRGHGFAVFERSPPSVRVSHAPVAPAKCSQPRWRRRSSGLRCSLMAFPHPARRGAIAGTKVATPSSASPGCCAC